MAASIPNFNEKLESWDAYQERLENYFVALDIFELNKKKSILINCVGPANYERVRNLCFPSSPNDKEYDELLKVFAQLFTPSVVVFKERKIFYDTRKPKNEKATGWHERIRRLALNCKFGARTEQALLDKFVTSYDGIVFDRFCEEGTDLSLAKALEIAQRFEPIETVTAPKHPNKKPTPPKKNENQKEQKHVPKQQAQGAKPKYPKKVNGPVTNVTVNFKKSD